MEHGGDPHQANDKGEAPIHMCQDSAVLKVLRGSMEEKEEKEEEEEEKKEQRLETEAEGREASEGEGGEREEEEEEGDEDVFEAKMETGKRQRDRKGG